MPQAGKRWQMLELPSIDIHPSEVQLAGISFKDIQAAAETGTGLWANLHRATGYTSKYHGQETPQTPPQKASRSSRSYFHL
jgi:hypothetical protein